MCVDSIEFYKGSLHYLSLTSEGIVSEECSSHLKMLALKGPRCQWLSEVNRGPDLWPSPGI